MINNHTDIWYLMYCSFPDLNWARLQIFDDGSASILDCDGNLYLFKSKVDAEYYLFEDEYTAFNKLDSDDESEYRIKISSITIPTYNSDDDLKGKMFIRS